MRVKLACCASTKQRLFLCTCTEPYSLVCDLSLSMAGAVGGRGGSELLDEHGRGVGCCACVLWTRGARLGPARSCFVRGKKLPSALSKRASPNEVQTCSFPLCRDHSAFFPIGFTGALDLSCSCIQSVSSHLFVRTSYFKWYWKCGPPMS